MGISNSVSSEFGKEEVVSGKNWSEKNIPLKEGRWGKNIIFALLFHHPFLKLNFLLHQLLSLQFYYVSNIIAIPLHIKTFVPGYHKAIAIKT